MVLRVTNGGAKLRIFISISILRYNIIVDRLQAIRFVHNIGTWWLIVLLTSFRYKTWLILCQYLTSFGIGWIIGGNKMIVNNIREPNFFRCFVIKPNEWQTLLSFQ